MPINQYEASIRGVSYCTVYILYESCLRLAGGDRRGCAGLFKKNKSVQSGIEPWKSPYRNPPVVWWARSRLRRGAEAIIEAGVELLCSRPGLRYSVDQTNVLPSLAGLQARLGLSEAELRKVVLPQPAVLSYSIEDNLLLTIDFLQGELGLSDKVLPETY